jgi:biopolymer transport protein ExbD
MRIRSKLNKVELDITPMIDMVFLLIVFFTLVLNFAAADQNERIKLPVSELAQPPEQPPTESMTLHVLTDGHVIYNSEEYPLRDLHRPIEHLLGVRRYLKMPPDEVTVILRADAQCDMGRVLDVIELCESFGLFRFILRVKQQEE